MGIWEDYQAALADEELEKDYIKSLEAFQVAINEWLSDVIYPESGEVDEGFDKGYTTAASEIAKIYRYWTAHPSIRPFLRDPADPDLGND